MRRIALASLPLLLAAFACAPADDADDTEGGGGSETTPIPSGDATAHADPASCAADKVMTGGTLTIGTDSPAYAPWFNGNDPSNGKGYESAVAYAVAERLGFTGDQVTWVKVPFNNSYKPGPKDFDFDINQISISAARAQVVDFSDSYYDAAQAVVALEGTAGAEATSLADLKDLRLGAQTGTTSLTAIREIIVPDDEPLVFEDTNVAKQALKNDQVDAILADLPTAFFISAVEIPGSVLVGQFQPDTGEQEQFGMLFEKGNPLVECVNGALAEMTDDGTLADLQQEWLSDVVDVPELS